MSLTLRPVRPVSGILFDKDGTLFDFADSWHPWTAAILDDLSGGDPDVADRLAAAIGFDRATGTFRADSPFIAGTNDTAARALAPQLSGTDAAELALYLRERAASAPLIEAVPLAPCLANLMARGLALGVMTNDDEMSARIHLREAGVLDMFDFVAGADSGYGAKPSPEPLLAFCDSARIAPAETVMVGDSIHDLAAGRAAGMLTLGVLTGPAKAVDLAPLAHAVLPDIGHVPDWLDGRITV
ncbi:MAG: HAD family hydrolase [Marinibacterium sp.]